MIHVNEIKAIYTPIKNAPQVKDSKGLSSMFRSLYVDGDINLQETFYCVYFNRGNVPISWKMISKGGMTSTIVDPKVVFFFWSA